MNFKEIFCLIAGLLSWHSACADGPVETARPVPATRPEMKQLLEDMKQRPYRIPLPKFTDTEKQALGDRVSRYESRLRYNYVPAEEGTVFGARRKTTDEPNGTRRSRDFTRNADDNMTLTYQFKTMLFWIVSRTNNCQYCLGHQEWKLSATGMDDDAIAALDCDWSAYSDAEQAAFRYARLLTYEPWKLSDESFAAVSKYFTPMQVLEMTMSVSGNNSINRWKEGTGIPQSSGNMFNHRRTTVNSKIEHSDTFLTPTADRYSARLSVVAPIRIIDGKPDGTAVSSRPQLDSPDAVLKKLARVAKRTPRCPLVDEAATAAWLADSDVSIPVSNWTRLLANFPNEGRGRLQALASRLRQTGDLTELQKARLCWIIARQDRAWYATGQALHRLRELGQTDGQIFALDGDWSEFSAADQAIFRFARNLAASPIASTDEDVAVALKETSPAVVVQTINQVAGCAYFDRLTEAVGLPLEQ